MLHRYEQSVANTLVEKRSRVRKRLEIFGRKSLFWDYFCHRTFSHAADWREIETADSQ